MTTVYLVNVGANASHAPAARSPVFADGRFIYVSFPTLSKERTQSYPEESRPFVRQPDRWRTHADPDWLNLTYGDYCANPRAGALKRAEPGDILLFWGMLWTNRDRSSGWSGFSGQREWYLLGALRIAEILCGGQHVGNLSSTVRARALNNAHLAGHMTLAEDHYVFIGNPERSRQLRYAVALNTSEKEGLIYRAFTSADRLPLKRNGTPAWKSSLRSCRPMWDLNNAEDRARAHVVAREILARNDFDLLAGC